MPDTNTPKRSLQDLADQEFQKLAAKSLKSGNPPTEQELKRFRSLKEIADVEAALHATVPLRRWPFIAAVVVAAVIIGLLVLYRLTAVEAVLQARVSEATFSVLKDGTLTQSVDTNFVAIISNGDPLAISLPCTKNQTLRNAGLLSLKGAKITIMPIDLPAGSQVTVRLQSAIQASIDIAPPEGQAIELSTTIAGPAQAQIGEGGHRATNTTVICKSPQALTAVAKSPFTISFNLQGSAPFGLLPDISVGKLTLQHTFEHISSNDLAPTTESTITSGTVHVGEPSEKTLDLDWGTNLSFASSDGVLSSLNFQPTSVISTLGKSGEIESRVNDPALELHYRGRVQGMTINNRSVMPSGLEWLTAQPYLTAYWIALAYVTGFMLAVLKWWFHDQS